MGKGKERLKQHAKNKVKKHVRKKLGKVAIKILSTKVGIIFTVFLILMLLIFGISTEAATAKDRSSSMRSLQTSRQLLPQSTLYLTDVPSQLRGIYPETSRCHVDLPWHVIAAIGSVETDHSNAMKDIYGNLDPTTKVDWATGETNPAFESGPMDGTPGSKLEQVPISKYHLDGPDGTPGAGEEVFDTVVGPYQLRSSYLEKYGIRSKRMGPGYFDKQNIFDNAETIAYTLCSFTTPVKLKNGTDYNKISLMEGLTAFYNEAHVFSQACPNSPAGYPVYAPCPEAPFPNCVDAFGRVPADAGLAQATTPGSVINVNETDPTNTEEDADKTDPANGPVVSTVPGQTTVPGATTTTSPMGGNGGSSAFPASSSINDYTVTRAAYGAAVSPSQAALPPEDRTTTTTTRPTTTTSPMGGNGGGSNGTDMPGTTTTTTSPMGGNGGGSNGTDMPGTTVPGMVINDPGVTTTTKPNLPPCPPLVTEPAFANDFAGWANQVIERAVEYGLLNPEAFGLVVENSFSYTCVVPTAFDLNDPNSTSTTTTTTVPGAKPLPATDSPEYMAMILQTIRNRESGVYNKGPNKGGASGAYQFVGRTWNNYGGYSQAYLAPPSVQDERAAKDVRGFLARGGIKAVPLGWYYPAAISNPALLVVIPRPDAGNTLSIGGYQKLWLDEWAKVSGGLVPDTPQCTPGTIASDPGAPPSGPGGARGPVVGPEQTQEACNTNIIVNKAIVANVCALVAAARAAGMDLSGGGYRTPEGQIATRRNNCGNSDYAIYEMPAKACHPPTARPGTSMHERGLAIDFTINGRTLNRSDAAYAWMVANAAKFQLYNYPVEPWHWSTNGK